MLEGFLERVLPLADRSVEVLEPESRDGEFLDRSYAGEAGARPYKLFVPPRYRGRPVPLVVMLHGCHQTPDDFAAGTRMNLVADEAGCLVAYPAQVPSANRSKCWNWYQPVDQARGQGEPAVIAGITREVMQDYAVDPTRVYVAGLSAGGAAAAIMGAAYPDLYAALGIHSGLACGSARDVASAFAAMREASTVPPAGPRAERVVPTILFHGDRDSTVNPANSDRIIAQAAAAMTLTAQTFEGTIAGGHPWRRTLYRSTDGAVQLEQWTIEGAGHAWSGGSPEGSYTDPGGPDASREMMRFFLEHRHPRDKGTRARA